MNHCPKLIKSQSPFFIFAKPLSDVNESFPISNPLKNGRNDAHTFSI